MLTVLVPDPSFGAAYNIVPALNMWQETRLISRRADGFRVWDRGLALDTPANFFVAHTLIEASAFTLVVGVEGIKILQGIGNDAWIRDRRIVAFMMGSRYGEHGATINNLMTDLGVDHLYVLPNLLDVAPKCAIPILQPVVIPETIEKPDRLTIMHAPGTPKKRQQKGTDMIERVIGRLGSEYDFDYRSIMWMDHVACLKVKQRAHIFIDQIPSKKWTHGLGMSGEEAMAVGSVVITAMYDQFAVKDFLPMSPIVYAYHGKELEFQLRQLLPLSCGELEKKGRIARQWAMENLSYKAWLAYFRKYLPKELAK